MQGDYKNVTISLGRLPYVSFVDEGMVIDDSVSGGQITVGNAVKGTLTVGRWNNDPDNNGNKTFSYQGIELYNDRNDKVTWGIAYHHLRNKDFFNGVYTDNGKDSINLWEVGLGWKMDDNFRIHGAYAWNTSGESANFGGSGYATDHAAKSWSVELDYKGADPKKTGSWGAFVAYRSIGNYAAVSPTYDAMTFGQQGCEIGFDIVPMRNFQATFKYFTGHDHRWTRRNLNNDRHRASKFFAELNFFF
ncbi:MAG: hypothetical protein IJS96_05810 [Schwartzia sp.]|nr:hypothetical protein [Schwartzia sp. (in: firmicutes)]